ncbi:uncharacterized protein LOC129881576 [Solanum dulcamara]|uniref:uncharacterized protein LOC129881576 n=1 Tax=Solanum dulcamara TaxID=45834 RepID=UPI002485EE1A|nr:uncharacterized protein LOC129881576 [Solanum dulcamara]
MNQLQLTFADEEETKIQMVFFNDHEKDSNRNYLSVNKEMEISFTNYTIVDECKSYFSMINFFNNFLFLEDATKSHNGTLFADVVCILIKAKAPMGEGKTKRRQIILPGER